MAVKHPPYHLRTNKAVDRLLLLSQIRAAINADVGLNERAAYHSLGGPFMEDLHLVHRAFPNMSLVCIESDSHTHARQNAHRFSSNLSLENSTLSNFIVAKYVPSKADIFWLDYTDFSLACLSELQSILRVLQIGSLIRITLRCDSPVYERSMPVGLDDASIAAMKQQVKDTFVKEFDRYIPAQAKKNPLPSLPSMYASLVRSIVRLAISDTLDKSSDREFLHIHSARYNDGTPMLSITGLVCERRLIRRTRNRLAKQTSLDFDPKWEKLHDINVPILSIQERMQINKALPYNDTEPAVGTILYSLLNYNVAESKPKTEAALEQYANYRNEYPSFVRLDIA
jgi:hypothetical protein